MWERYSVFMFVIRIKTPLSLALATKKCHRTGWLNLYQLSGLKKPLSTRRSVVPAAMKKVSHTKLDPEECRIITEGLVELHGKPTRSSDPLEHYNLTQGHHQVYVLDSLIRTMLSQNTTDKTSIRAFRKLKETFPEWEEVRVSPNKDVEEAIREGGLSEIKTERIKLLLNHLKSTRNECSLEWLREKDTEFVKEYLGQFKGVGPKTISCTLMFALHRDDFPVDTHVLRISKDLGWIPKSASREDAYHHLNEHVPDYLKYDLHVLLVEHGKTCRYCNSRKSGSIEASKCPIKIFKAVQKSGIGNADVNNKRVKEEVGEEKLTSPTRKKIAMVKKEEDLGL